MLKFSLVILFRLVVIGCVLLTPWRIAAGATFPAGTSIADIVAVKGTAIASVTLPAATRQNSGSFLTYTVPNLPDGLNFDGDTRVISGTPSAATHINGVTCNYNTQEGEATTQESLTFKVIVHTAPTFGAETISNITATQNTAITSVTLPQATDENTADTLTYSLPNLPSGLMFNSGTRVLSGTPTTPTPERTYTYTATDSTNRKATLTFTITVNAAPAPPTLPSGDIVIAATVGTPLTRQLPVATDPNNDSITYSLTGADLPGGLRFTAATRTVSGTPTTPTPERTYTYTARDSTGRTATRTVKITVTQIQRQLQSPQFPSGDIIIAATVGTPLTRTLPQVTDPNADTITYSLTGADLPNDLTFTAATRAVSGTPTTPTPQRTYTYTARDSTGRTATRTVKITVNAADDTFQADVGSAIPYCPPPAHPWLKPDQIAQDTLLFNEVYNAYEDEEDWIELKNISNTPISLKTWEISLHSCDPDETHEDAAVVGFPDWTLPPGEVLLITPVDPELSALAGGVDIRTGKGGKGTKHYYLVAPDFQLPAEPYLLILRSATGKNMTPEALEDVLGTYFYGTAAETAPLTPGSAWHRTALDKQGYLAAAWTESGYRGGIGYDKLASGQGLGTPGYPHDAVINTSAQITSPENSGQLIFSELMFASRGGLHSLPQWIEVYNPSETETVNLNGWTLEIESREADDAAQHVHSMLKFREVISVLPQRTVLLVTWGSRHAAGLQPNEIYNLSAMYTDGTTHHERRNALLGQDGFFLKLSNPTGKVSDTIGNLDGDATTADAPAWALPVCQLASGSRTSVMRRAAVEIGTWSDGRDAASWARSVDVLPGAAPAYYGHATDISAPGMLYAAGAGPTGDLIISEVMFTSRGGPRSLPQWIEVYNPSFTQAIDLQQWELAVEVRSAETYRHTLLKFKFPAGVHVLPNQTVLLVTWRGRHSDHFPKHRVSWLPDLQVPERGVSVVRNGLLSHAGFSLVLRDSTGVLIDLAGNLDGVKRTHDAPTWELPAGETSAGHRTSMRRLSKKGVAYKGTVAAGWVRAADTPVSVETYYGHPTDIGTPGYRGGGPLPVQLSSFRPERTDTGAVVIKWTTESEKDNAGFHILRSRTRQGPFVRITVKLIAGGGTRRERHHYSWTDTTAKPNTVYYYRLEEISFSGERQTLATLRLKGDVSASGKSLLRWGLLKTQK